MERRTFESHMEWEYQDQGPMDPTSPFVASIKNGNKSNTAFGASTAPPESSSQPSPLSRTQSTPSRPLANTPNLQPRSIFSYPSSQNPIQRTNTAPPFRNPAFTTPRKFDLDTLSEASPAESTPDVTDISGLTDTPDLDSCRSLRHVNISPIRNRALVNSMRRSPGKGDIARPMFGSRDKVRKRKRRADDKDISGFRLPYRHSDEWDESDSPDSDDSTWQPNEHQRRRADRVKSAGWFGGFLTTIQKHPTAPHILGYWLNLLFNAAVLGVVSYILWWVIQGFRSELDMTHMSERSALFDTMAKCAKEYTDNRCAPPDARLPGLRAMCEEWETCMHQDPDEKYPLRSGAKNIVEIFNNIFEAMHWKTMVAFFFLVLITCTSGVTLFKSSPPPSFPAAPLAPPQSSQHPYMYGQTPRTPHRKAYAYLRNDETPETDTSMDDSSLLLSSSYGTPARWRSPIKDHRPRSPTKSRSPSKRY